MAMAKLQIDFKVICRFTDCYRKFEIGFEFKLVVYVCIALDKNFKNVCWGQNEAIISKCTKLKKNISHHI